ncbi:MAG: GNAT family N-acetyltransferase [Saprospiraceae bacterium]|nr:GNAT family N-acetyltransferase [Saprospiraceae bacterium]
MIRAYQPTDVEDIIQVWTKASRLAHPFLDPAFIEQEKYNIRHVYLPNTESWVSVSEERVIGFISMMQNEVGAIFLDPTFHSQGFGKAMMDHVAQQHAILEVEVFKANHIGRAFYDRYGFQFLKEYFHEESGQSMLRLRFSQR